MSRQSAPSLQPLLGGIIAALLVVISFNSFVVINPGQAGVLSVLGKAQNGALLEGLHF
ncbi:MAG: prohibitin family protein, partial [Crocosphaera sp.]